jgi:ABC-type Fe3+-siderophore transport system permease subunit
VGSTSKIDGDEIPLILAITVVGIVLVWTMHKKLDVMYAGDRGAKSMGVNAGRVRIVTLAIVSLMTACLVSLSGTIGFIGLVGPHIARIFVGSNNRYLIPASAAFGAAFMALADTIAKVTGPDGLPVGVISSMIGGPLFVYILIRQRKSAWA